MCTQKLEGTEVRGSIGERKQYYHFSGGIPEVVSTVFQGM